MRTLFLSLGLLLPQLGWAKNFYAYPSPNYPKFEEGSYVLAASRNVRHPALLKLQNDSKLVVKRVVGTASRANPAQIHSFCLGKHHHTTARNFHVPGGFGLNSDEAFVELLGSGQVVFMRYNCANQTGLAMGGGATSLNAHLLRRSADTAYVAVQPAFYFSAGGSRFRDAMRPLLAGHPNLVRLLDEKYSTPENLPAVIRALNAGQPYQLPLSHYELLKQQALAKQATKAAGC